MAAPTIVFAYQALVSCLSILLKVDPAYDWAICPGSTNCLCPEGFTGQTGGAAPRCLKFTTANQLAVTKTPTLIKFGSNQIRKKSKIRKRAIRGRS